MRISVGLWLAVGLLFLSQFGQAMDCRYDGKRFLVSFRGENFSYPASPNYKNYSISCVKSIAALYDGDDFIVFDGGSKRFEWRAAKNGYSFSLMATSERMAVLYDGETFHVYDGGKKAFLGNRVETEYYHTQIAAGGTLAALYDGSTWHIYDAVRSSLNQVKANSKFNYSRLVIGQSIVLFYDGSDLHIYDANSGMVNRTSVEPQFHFTTILVEPRAALYYGGNSLVGYCSKNRVFASVPTDFDPFTRCYVDQGTGFLVMIVNGKYFILDPGSCKISEGK